MKDETSGFWKCGSRLHPFTSRKSTGGISEKAGQYRQLVYTKLSLHMRSGIFSRLSMLRFACLQIARLLNGCWSSFSQKRKARVVNIVVSVVPFF